MLIKLILLLGHDLHNTKSNGHSFDLVIFDLALAFVTGVLSLFRAILYWTCGSGAFLGILSLLHPEFLQFPLLVPLHRLALLEPIFKSSFPCLIPM